MDLREHLQFSLGNTYTLERELGGGGMSRVFVAEEAALGRRVVIKVLAPDLSADLSAERFGREVRLAASLQHPNIVPVLLAGSADGVPYYVMPLVRGDSLRERLDRDGALRPRFAIALLRDIARALAHAHEAGVVHRDIKPGNILIAGDVAVVVDFGIAKAVAASRGDRFELAESGRDLSTALTRLGTAIGTPAYMAPEQATGDPRTDHRADLYALGVVAYEMLAGHHPFAERRTQHELIVAHLTQTAPALESVRSDVPRALAALVHRCLAKDPGDRPNGARGILDELDALPLAAAVTPPNGASAMPLPDADSATSSIAILPFENLSSDPEQQFFTDGLTEELIADLSKVRALRVISRASAVRFGESGRPIADAPTMLGVRWVLVGSVRHAGTAVRITAQLVDAERDQTVWSDRFGGSAEDVFELQERLSREIVGALRVTLSPEDHVTLARPRVDPRVRECCARARRDLFLVSDHGLASARAIVEEGIRVLGEHSQLLAMLGMVHWQEVNSGTSSDERQVEEAERLARQALARDADCPEAYMLLGFIRVARGPTAEALLHLRRVCELDPANVDALGLLAVGLMLRGNEADATRAVERALAIDPLSPSSHAAAGYLYTFVGDREASATAWASARRLAGASAAYAFFEACAVLAIDDRDRALGMLDEAATGTDGMSTLARAMACAIRGEGEAVQAMIAPLRPWIERDVSMAWPAAQIFAQAGAAEEAIRWLGVAVDLGLVHYALLAERDVLLAPVRGHPAFAALLERVRADAPMAAVAQ